MHRPRGKQSLDFRFLVRCTMPIFHWEQHVSCALGPCTAVRHVGASPCWLFHSELRAATNLPVASGPSVLVGSQQRHCVAVAVLVVDTKRTTKNAFDLEAEALVQRL